MTFTKKISARDILALRMLLWIYSGARRICDSLTKLADSMVSEQEDDVDLTYLKSQLAEEKLVLKVLHEISDGYLWRIFDFNRPLLYFMGREDRPIFCNSTRDSFAKCKAGQVRLRPGHLSFHPLWHHKLRWYRGCNCPQFRWEYWCKRDKIGQSTKGYQVEGKAQTWRKKAPDLERLANSGQVTIDNESVGIVDAKIPCRISLKSIKKASSRSPPTWVDLISV